MSYLLDTNIVSDLVRHPQGRIAARIGRSGDAKVVTSIIVAAELRFGAERKKSINLATQLETILGALEIVGFQTPADRHYAALRARLEASGKPISANDMLIAAHALALDYVLVTDNVREFSRVKGLRIENWLR
jgi:tRNA(fMet)-specific endonuclease VapC